MNPTCIHKTQTGGDSLVGWDAGHGDGVGGNAVGKAGTEGSLAGDIAGLYLLQQNRDQT